MAMARASEGLRINRPKRKCAENDDYLANLRKRQAKEREREIKAVLGTPAKLRSKDDKKLLRECKDVVKELERRSRLKEMVKKKTQEVEDSSEVLGAKTDQLVEAIKESKSLVVYTGAGISTAASIPDYRGPSGVWTLLQKGQEVRTKSLVDAEPTLTHMAITELHRQGVVHHVVSQNCDGLHLRSGLPQEALSEIHGNMFIEVCTECNPELQYIRLFDVTEKTACRRHWTGRLCPECGGALRDSIVHFGEKGAVEQPLNWSAAAAAAGKADMILCLGSTLKVLKQYSCLWGMNRPKSKHPKLYIVNLQWTPKDKMAVLKIHGRCDVVMHQVMSKLGLEIPQYKRSQDPIFSLATPLKKHEITSFSTKMLQPQCPLESGSDQNEPVTSGSSQNTKVSSNDVVDTEQSSETSSVERDLESSEDGLRTEGSQTTALTKPGWFGRGYKKVTRSRKRRKVSQIF